MCLSVCAVRPSVRAVRLALVVLSLSATSTVVSAQQVAAPSAAQDANVLPEIQRNRRCDVTILVPHAISRIIRVHRHTVDTECRLTVFGIQHTTEIEATLHVAIITRGETDLVEVFQSWTLANNVHGSTRRYLAKVNGCRSLDYFYTLGAVGFLCDPVVLTDTQTIQIHGV